MRIKNKNLLIAAFILLCMQFAASQNRELQPTDKTKMEQLFIERLSDSTFVGELVPVPIIRQNIKQYKSDIYIQSGKRFVANDFRSDIYLQKTVGSEDYELLFKREYPIESLITLFNSRVPSPIQTAVTVVKLDGKRVEKQLPLNRLQKMLSEGNQVYSGLYSIQDNQIKITVIYHNSAYQYINMLVATADLNTLFSEHALITADLYLCIMREDAGNDSYKVED